MRRFARAFALGIVSILLLTTAAWAACVEDPVVCTFNGSTPNITVMTNPNGYYVNNYGVVRCNKPAKVINVRVILTANGVTMSFAGDTCYNAMRCSAANIVYVGCGADGICQQYRWGTIVGGSYAFEQCGERRKVNVPLHYEGLLVTNPRRCT